MGERELLGWLADPLGPPPRLLVVAAHPDDETLGAGALLCRAPDAAHLVHTSDGAPRERGWWGTQAPASREGYARLRRAELEAALAVAGVDAARARCLGYEDQAVARHLPGAVRRIAAVLEEVAPDVVLTHPYEGGHPDHDSTAFAVHAACRLRERGGAAAPLLVEFTSYFARGEEMVTGEFVPAAGGAEVVRRLDASEAERKAEMLERFASQRETLAAFSVGEERYRIAPRYDFAAAPHPGRLNYERMGWGEPGERWRRRARETWRMLDLGR
jgi:LmbE family N-acetylglucosaminyl deacetylase